ncbi:MAG: hypothetical protein WCG91_03675 [Candidatus Shapirobacteria bacterium]
MQTQSKDRKTSNTSAVVKGNIIVTPNPQFGGPVQNNKGFRPNSRFQSINRGRR